MIHSFPAPIIVHAFNPRFNRGIRGIRDARAGVHLEEEGGGGHEHAHVEEQTPMRKFRGRLLNQRCTQVRAFT